MRKQYSRHFFAFITVAILIASGFGANYIFASGKQQASAAAPPAVTAGKAVQTAAVLTKVVNMKNVPMASAQVTTQAVSKPFSHTGFDAQRLEQLEKAAEVNKNAPVSTHSYALPQTKANKAGPQTPVVSTSFQGLSQSCCQPPDHALAASPSWVLQGVNLQFAVYNTAGVLQPGWPKSTSGFFGVPSPGACSPTPFMSDPRAFYDFTDQRFWVAALEAEGAVNNCPFKSLYWIAVSQTNNPNGLWNVYAFNMALGTTNGADYTQFGFDGQAIYFSGNMFANALRGSYQYAEIFGALKAPMESGLGVTAFGFFGLSVGGVRVDTVQPVEAIEYGRAGPRGGIFVNSFNIFFGGGVCSLGCSGIVVWTLKNPGTAANVLTGVVVPSFSYAFAPRADQPGCVRCVPLQAQPDTRISATPVYHAGLVSFGLVTGINNGTQIVPGIFWGQIAPVLNDDGSIASASMFQQGYYNYSGDGAATYPALMPDAAGNLFMVFEFMNNAFSPGVAYTARRATFARGFFHDGGFFLRAGSAPTTNVRWGDFNATSYDGFGSDKVWLAGEFSTSTGAWSTYIGADRFTLGVP